MRTARRRLLQRTYLDDIALDAASVLERAKKPKAERATLQKKKPEKARPAPQKLGGKRRKPGASS